MIGVYEVEVPHTLQMPYGLEDVLIEANVDRVERIVDITKVTTVAHRRPLRVTERQRGELEQAALDWTEEAWG